VRIRTTVCWDPEGGSSPPQRVLSDADMATDTQAITDGQRDALAASVDIIGAKWTALLIYDLANGMKRFRELEHACAGISSRTLAERLRALERAGIVRRHSYPESPPRVEYELTEKGRDLMPVIDAMAAFGRSWLVPEASALG
jgi:DNA-binding HxlR family transcriptional regulator